MDEKTLKELKDFEEKANEEATAEADPAKAFLVGLTNLAHQINQATDDSVRTKYEIGKSVREVARTLKAVVGADDDEIDDETRQDAYAFVEEMAIALSRLENRISETGKQTLETMRKGEFCAPVIVG